MSSEWPRIEIGQVAKLRSGFPSKSADWKETGVPVIKIANVKGGRIIPDGCGFVSSEVASKSAEWYTRTGDVLIAMTGYVGEVAQAKPGESYLINQRVGRFDFLPKAEVEPTYFFYHLQHPDTRAELEGVARGSAQPNLSAGDAHKIKITLPPLTVQREIAATLSSLDDRISLLRETNTTLEAIAQAMFKSWFVDFDPVHAKMQGRAPEGMDQATAALFSDSFQDSELGPVPRGWNPARLDSFIELAYGKALKSDSRRPGAVPVYGSGGITGWHDTALVNEASLVVGRKGTVGSIYWESRPFFPIDTVFYVKASKPLTYCHQLLMTLGLNDMNTDAAVPGLNRENVYRLQVPDAPLNVVEAFDDIVSALRRSIDRNNDQAQTLSNARDALLPRLISGQL